VTRWVIDAALSQIAAWLALASNPVAINVGGICPARICPTCWPAHAAPRVPARLISLEITEAR